MLKIKKTIKTTLFILCGLMITACETLDFDDKYIKTDKPHESENSIIIAAPAPRAKDLSVGFRKAERLYSIGSYESAAETYKQFIAGAKADHPLFDNAYFKTGLSLYRMGRYREALNNFSVINQRLPYSELYPEALINSGICYIQLNKPKKAEKMFSKALPLADNTGHKAYIYYYYAKLYEKESYSVAAIDKYYEAERSATDNNLISSSKRRAARIINNFLSEAKLLMVTKRYEKKWPAKMAFKSLLRLYGDEKDTEAYDRTKAAYESQFDDEDSGGFFGQFGGDKYTPEQIKIGIVLPISGPNAKTGRELLRGVQLAFNSFHDLASERRIQPIIRDSGSGSGEASDIVEQLADDKNVLLVIGPVFSKDFRRSAQVAGRKRMPVFSPSATTVGISSSSKYLFRNTLTNRLEAEKMAQLAARNLGLKRFAILYSSDRYGQEMNRYFTEEFERLGGEVMIAEPFSREQTDFGEQARKIGGMTDDTLRNEILNVASTIPGATPNSINRKLEEIYDGKLSAPKIVSYGGGGLNRRNFLPGLTMQYDGIFMPGLYNKIGLILPLLEFYNIKEIIKLAGKGVNHPEFVKIAEQYAEGVIFLDGFYKHSSLPHVQKFVRDYQLYFREEPTILSAQAYDAASMALTAISRGADSRSSITDYLESLNSYEGVSGTTSFDKDGDTDKTVFYLTIDDGKIIEYNPPRTGSFF